MKSHEKNRIERGRTAFRAGSTAGDGVFLLTTERAHFSTVLSELDRYAYKKSVALEEGHSSNSSSGRASASAIPSASDPERAAALVGK